MPKGHSVDSGGTINYTHGVQKMLLVVIMYLIFYLHFICYHANLQINQCFLLLQRLCDVTGVNLVQKQFKFGKNPQTNGS